MQEQTRFDAQTAAAPAAVRALHFETAPQARRIGIAAPTASWVAAGLLLFAAVWIAQLAHSSLVPPTDDIEQLTWVRSLEWGYYKHPPLPTWLIWLPVKVFGLSATTAYVMGAACTLGAMALLWHLLARLRGTTYAAVALLAALCITYYNGRLYYYNHNVVLLLLSTASAALCWQAFATRRLRWWMALGVAIGLGALAKYQIAVTIASILAFAAHQRAWRDRQHRFGALLAGIVALMLFLPHLWWLRQHDFAPFHYAMESSLGAGLDAGRRVADSLHWLVDQVLNRALPALIVLAVAGLSAPRRSATAPSDAGSRQIGAGDPARALLLAWGVVPLLFMPAVGLTAGADLQLHWGTPFLLFAVPAAMELLPTLSWGRTDLARVVAVFMMMQVVLLGIDHLTSPRGPSPWREHHWRAFDSMALAERIAGPARSQLGGPIRVVIGPASIAGALALRLPERPVVLIDADPARSPWVAPDLVDRCGAVEIGSTQALNGGTVLGPSFPGLSWRTVLRNPTVATCPPSSVNPAAQVETATRTPLLAPAPTAPRRQG